MELKEFTKEEIPKAIARWIEFKAYGDEETSNPFEIEEVLVSLRTGTWLKELEEGCKSNSYTPPHWNS